MRTTSLVVVALLAGCSRGQGGSGLTADAAEIDAAIPADAAEVDAAIPADADADAVAAPDAGSGSGGSGSDCWSCGLPSGSATIVYDLTDASCIYEFSTTYSIEPGDLVVTLTGESPGEWTVDLYYAGYSEGATPSCETSLQADGTWQCNYDSGESEISGAGRVDGLGMTGGYVYDYLYDGQSQGTVECDHLAGSGTLH